MKSIPERDLQPNGARVGLATACLAAVLLAGGCATSEERYSCEDLDRYVAFCREIALDPTDEEIGRAAHEFKKDFSIVYADARHLSFQAVEYFYLGGAHGSTRVTVGTIDRRTGRLLRVADFVPAEKKAALKRQLHDEAVRRLGGEDRLQNEVTVIENFCLKGDGLHFVYNQFDIACYADGIVEVVIDPQKL